jgi:NAD(P)-dependent dehydrogenase (short-subunit alcohol dehydrogenase family)
VISYAGPTDGELNQPKLERTTANRGDTMSGRLDGKVAVITGGASGMGRQTALRFLDEGARVVVADLNEENGKELLNEVSGGGRGDAIRFVTTDVAQEDDVVAMIATATDEFGRLDIVFNNAGVGGAFGAITDVAVEDWDFTLGVLLRGVFLGIKHGARAMKAQGDGGAIVNTASVAGLSGGSGPHAYSAAKAAVINLTRSTAIELASDRIRVNAICPGAINTPLINMGNPDAMGDMFNTMQPWPSHGTGDHIAGAALFLASDDSEFVTGEAIVVDGGMTAGGPNFFRRMGIDSAWGGMTGVNHGSTGVEHTIRPTD